MDFALLADETVDRLKRHWEEGWNNGDVDTIMAPFAENIVFSSPGIALMTGDASRTTIEGRDALRAYIENALERTRDVRYTPRATYVGTDSIIVTYEAGIPKGGGRVGADSMRVNDQGQVVEWRCHY